MSIISVNNLYKNYRIVSKKPGIASTIRHFFNRDTRLISAVKNVSFDIEQGEIVGFIGPNGAGKTTTLKMLTGLIHPSFGQIRIDGHIPKFRKQQFLKKITLVMGQKQQLIWDLPPLESLKVNAAVYEIGQVEAKKRITELSEMLEIDHLLTRPVRKLSLGERMKSELMVALIHRPSILFLDEPTLGLDINAQVKLRDFLKNYNKLYGATILITSHYMEDITSLCKRVLVVDEGNLVYDGTLEKLVKRMSPCRLLRIELSEKIPSEYFHKFGDVIDNQEFIVSLLIAREKLTDTLSLILEECKVKDLDVREPPIEDVIRDLFKYGPKN